MTGPPQGRQTSPRAVAIVPAAGESRRMGAAKLLLGWGAGTVIESTIAAWRQSCVAEVIVVVSPRDERLAEVCRVAGAQVVVPPAPPADMKASLQHGIRFAAARPAALGIECFLVAPADMPWLEPAAIDRLVAAFASASQPIVAPTHHGRRGHPIVLAWPLAEEVLQLSANETLKTVIARHNMLEIECPASVLGDLDTPEDYEETRRRYGK